MIGKKQLSKTVLIMAGGTGGHIFPALATADCLQKNNIKVFWLGTRKAIEAEIVGKTNIPIEFITVSGLRGKGWGRLLLAPIKLCRAVWQSIRILLKVKPACVLGMGGFVSGPGGLAAWLLRIPLLIHEQNAIMGMTNKILSRLAKKVLLTYPRSYCSDRTVYTGNPIRQSIHKENILQQAENNGNENSVQDSNYKSPFKLLVLGGSQGAMSINKIMPDVLLQLQQHYPVEIWHQTGKRHLDTTEKYYAENNSRAKVEAFIDDMATAYQWADLIVCRAGATTLAEITAAGAASILIPFPYAVDDHQRENAKFLEEANAAICIIEKELSVDLLVNEVQQLIQQPQKWQAMKKASRLLAKPDAADNVARQCIEMCYG